MKTQNNNQETSKSHVSKMTLVTSAVLVSVVLISFSVSAQDFWKELSNTVGYGKMALTLDEISNETKNADDAIEAIYSEVAVHLNNSIESSSDASAKASPELLNEMSINSSLNYAEQETAESADAEIARYAKMVITAEEKEESLATENRISNENFLQDAEQETADGVDAEIAKYADKIMTGKEVEEAAETQSPMTDVSFLQNAEQETADGVDAEIAKYARMIVSTESTDVRLSLESSSSNDNFFQEAAQYTADGSDAQISLYAKKIINNQGFENTANNESWGLTSENLNN